MDAGRGADEVDNRVDGTDLVEVDGFDRHAMKLGFGLGHALEHAEGGVANFRIQLGLFQEITDFGPVPAVMVVVIVVMVVAGFLDQEAETGKAAPNSLFSFEGDLFG
jgi:hypothetical protein